ncbi:MAG: bifunctional UDP-N-acetylglucosamine diphosphorylase/glucosamine-1-phosphate N-acetyltransferase GlmU [Alphaproteobacteria bacterium]|nr:bifunctional UDP-N-acetylglucosamine diphosphorylase/glucosamine-1-phosphate N-acetyltransferase GlmU [Alphaproteobacteria bacterium]
MNEKESFPPLACIVLAAGQGTRMKSALPKVLHRVAGVPMIQHVLTACDRMGPEKIVVIVGPSMADVEKVVAPHPCVIQRHPLGTGDAVKAAADALVDFAGDIIVLFGDSPLISAESIRKLQEKRQKTQATVVVAGFSPENPASYGRLVINEEGNLSKIVEASEATSEEKAIRLCNGGLMLFDGSKLWPILEALRNDNAKKEFFLTDCVALAQQYGGKSVVCIIPEDDVLGVNTKVELAQAEKIMQRRLREKAMLAGVTMIDPDSVFLSADTTFGQDVTLAPNVIIGQGVTIGNGVEIKAFSHLEHAQIGNGAIIGPFARIRPHSRIEADAHIGNFVEIKNSTIGEGTKVNHLSYIGDAKLGTGTNIGAGTITANYDGVHKNQTQIGAGVSIGSNVVLVAPISIGDGATIGAGSVITKEVPPDSLAIARGKQENLKGWASRLKCKKKKSP